MERTQPWKFPGNKPRLQCAPDGLVHSNLYDVNLVTYYRGFGGWDPPSPYSIHWDPALFISITLGFGSFTFPVAKTIGVFWDLVVGRGGQLLLVFLVYPTIRLAVVLVLEGRIAVLATFSRTFIERMSLNTMSNVLYNVVDTSIRQQPGKFGARLANSIRLIGGFVCCAYAIVFPTTVSAMTVYQAELTPYLSVPPKNSGILVEASQITIPENSLLDGYRIVLQDRVSTTNMDPEDEERLLACKKAQIFLFFIVYLQAG